MLGYIVLGATYAFAAAVQPGQFQAYLISQALASGWRRALPGALAPLLSDLPVIALVLLVLTQVPRLFLHLLQLAGGFFLLFLAFEAYRAWRENRSTAGESAASGRQTLFKAALVNLLNPNPYLAWGLVMGPVLIGAWYRDPWSAVAFLAAFYSTMVLTNAAIVLLFASARSLGSRVVRALIGLSAVALAGFGIYQIWAGAAALLSVV